MRALKLRLDSVVQGYRAEFAGQQRGTRNLERLEELLAEARAVHRALERRLGPLRKDERELLAEASRWVKLLTSERAAIAEEKGRPERTPQEKQIAEPGGRVNLYLAMLRARHHPDAKRVDLALLYEVLEGLDDCQKDMVAVTPEKTEQWMRENLDGVRGSLAACKASETELAKAMASGGVAERRSFLLQLGADLEHFVAWEERYMRAGARRRARDRYAAATFSMLADRVRALGGLTGADADAVASMLARAEQLAAREPVEYAADNVNAVIKELEAELASIAAVYKKEFAGKMRAQVDLPLLWRVLHRASSVAIQATDLWKAAPSERTESFRFRARERAFLYEDEERAVSEQQSSKR